MIDTPVNNAVLSESSRYMRLYQAVILTAVRESCWSQQEAYNNFMWAKSDDGTLICDFANINQRSLVKFFRRLSEDELLRDETICNLHKANRRHVTATRAFQSVIQQEFSYE